jgi:hypothetical protein
MPDEETDSSNDIPVRRYDGPMDAMRLCTAHSMFSFFLLEVI